MNKTIDWIENELETAEPNDQIWKEFILRIFIDAYECQKGY